MPDPGQRRRELAALLARLSVKHGSFRLASGRESDFYVDCRQTVLHPDGMALTGAVLVDAWTQSGLGIDAVGGPATGAVPLMCAFVLEARRRGIPVPGFYVRPRAKGHGTKSRVEGLPGVQRGARVLMLEDVITTGGSCLSSIEAVREAGHHVVALFCLVDREEGGRAALEGAGVPVTAIFRRSDFTAPAEGGP